LIFVNHLRLYVVIQMSSTHTAKKAIHICLPNLFVSDASAIFAMLNDLGYNHSQLIKSKGIVE